MAGVRFNVEVLGDRALAQALRELPEKLDRRVLRTAMRGAFKVVLDRARQRVPVASGALRKSLKLRARRGGRHRIAFAIFTGGKEDLGIPTKTKAGKRRGYYPAAIEFGWRNVAARPWMRPALRESEALVLAKLRSDLWAGIQRLAAELRGGVA